MTSKITDLVSSAPITEFKGVGGFKPRKVIINKNDSLQVVILIDTYKKDGHVMFGYLDSVGGQQYVCTVSQIIYEFNQ